MTRRAVQVEELTESQGLRFELAKEVLSGEIGRRSVALRKLADGEERASAERDLTRMVHLKNRLLPSDAVLMDAILDKDFGDALEEDRPLRRAI